MADYIYPSISVLLPLVVIIILGQFISFTVKLVHRRDNHPRFKGIKLLAPKESGNPLEIEYVLPFLKWTDLENLN